MKAILELENVPKNCAECQLLTSYARYGGDKFPILGCQLTKQELSHAYKVERHSDCPLIILEDEYVEPIEEIAARLMNKHRDAAYQRLEARRKSQEQIEAKTSKARGKRKCSVNNVVVKQLI